MDNSFKDNRDFTCDHYTVDCQCGDHSEQELRENWRQCQGMRQLRNEMEEEEVQGKDEEEEEVDFQSKDHPTEAASNIAITKDDSSTLQLPPPPQSADLELQQSTTTAAASTSGDPPIFIEEDQKVEAAAAVGGDGEQLQLLRSHEAMGDIAREGAAAATTALHSNNFCCRCLKSLPPSSDFSSVDADEDAPANTASHSESGAIAAQEGNRLSEEAMLQAIREAVAEAMSTVVLPAIKQQQQEQEQFSQRTKDLGDVNKVEEKPPLPPPTPVIGSESPPSPPLQSLLEVVDPSCPGCVEYLRRKKKKKENQSHFAPRDWRRRLAAEEGSASSLPRDPRLNRTAELLLVHEAELRQAAHHLHAAYIRPHLAEGPLAEAVAGLLADGERLLTETVNPPLERAVERAADGLAVLASATADAVRWLADDLVLSVGDGLLATAAALRRAASTVAHQGGLIAADLIGEEVVAAAAGDLSTSASTLGSASTLEDVAKECPTGPALEQVKTTTSSSRTTPLGWLWKQVLAPPPEEQWQSNSGNGLGHWPASTGLTEWPPHHSSGAP